MSTSPVAVAAPPPTLDDLLVQAEALLPKLRERDRKSVV